MINNVKILWDSREKKEREMTANKLISQERKRINQKAQWKNSFVTSVLTKTPQDLRTIFFLL